MKNGNAILWKIISILVTLAILAGGAIYGYASLNHEVVDNSEDIDAMEPVVDSNKTKIIGIEKDISFMSQQIAEQAVMQKQMLILQQDILDEVRK